MGYTNSPLVAYTKISPNRTKNRNHAIDTITIHCVVGQCSVETIGNVFAPESRQASSNYGVGVDGRIGMYCEEKDRSWCSSNAANDHRAITIEVASDTTHPYAVKDVVYNSLIKLVADICKRNGIKKLVWSTVKNNRVNHLNGCNMTVHRDYANKSCPGDYLYERHGDIANKVNAILGAAETPVTTGLQATALKGLSNADVIKKVSPLFTADQKKSGILASVSLAQFILESGYGSSELAQNANNCFGMKKSLSGNTWAGSAWDGRSVYVKKTQEQNKDGSYVTITADFRKYPCVENSVADHSAYLLGAMNGSKKRYEGLAGEKDYKKAIQIIKDGGYATSLSYVTNVCNIVEKWNLTQYDTGVVQDTPQEGAGGSFPAVPFTVKVLISDLNYRSCGSMEGAVKGQTGKGVFTIVEVKDGWGKLKSGAGWIYLMNPNYCTVQGRTVAATPTPAKSVTEIAKEVIAGKWGNGTDRKNRLQAAGYNYSEVQSKVNALLS